MDNYGQQKYWRGGQSSEHQTNRQNVNGRLRAGVPASGFNAHNHYIQNAGYQYSGQNVIGSTTRSYRPTTVSDFSSTYAGYDAGKVAFGYDFNTGVQNLFSNYLPSYANAIAGCDVTFPYHSMLPLLSSSLPLINTAVDHMSVAEAAATDTATATATNDIGAGFLHGQDPFYINRHRSLFHNALQSDVTPTAPVNKPIVSDFDDLNNIRDKNEDSDDHEDVAEECEMPLDLSMGKRDFNLASANVMNSEVQMRSNHESCRFEETNTAYLFEEEERKNQEKEETSSSLSGKTIISNSNDDSRQNIVYRGSENENEKTSEESEDVEVEVDDGEADDEEDDDDNDEQDDDPGDEGNEEEEEDDDEVGEQDVDSDIDDEEYLDDEAEEDTEAVAENDLSSGDTSDDNCVEVPKEVVICNTGSSERQFGIKQRKIEMNNASTKESKTKQLATVKPINVVSSNDFPHYKEHHRDKINKKGAENPFCVESNTTDLGISPPLFLPEKSSEKAEALSAEVPFSSFDSRAVEKIGDSKKGENEGKGAACYVAKSDNDNDEDYDSDNSEEEIERKRRIKQCDLRTKRSEFIEECNKYSSVVNSSAVEASLRRICGKDGGKICEDRLRTDSDFALAAFLSICHDDQGSKNESRNDPKKSWILSETPSSSGDRKVTNDECTSPIHIPLGAPVSPFGDTAPSPKAKTSSSCKRMASSVLDFLNSKRPRSTTELQQEHQHVKNLEEQGKRFVAGTGGFHMDAMELLLPKTAMIGYGMKMDIEKAPYSFGNAGVPLPPGMCRVRMQRNDLLWELMFASVIVGYVNDHKTIIFAFKNCAIRVIDLNSGKLIFPPIALRARPCCMKLKHNYLLCVTTDGYINVWNVVKKCCIIGEQSVESFSTIPESTDKFSIQNVTIREDGSPVIALSTGKVFSYSVQMKTWLMVGDNSDPVTAYASHTIRQSAPCNASAVQDIKQSLLHQMQSSVVSGNNARTPPSSELGEACTVTYLEQQLSAAFQVESPNEFRHWLLVLVRFLLQQGESRRLRQICEDMLGPLNNRSSGSDDNATTLGLPNKSLLRDVLMEMGSHLHSQRLFTEISDQVASLEDS